MTAGGPLLNRTQRVELARWVLAGEQLVAALWPVLALVLAFLVIASFDLLSALPAWLHAGILLAFLASLGVAGATAWRRFAWPDRLTARRRLEVASGVPHRPLEALEDRPVVGAGDASGALWEAHKRRMERLAAPARLFWPRATLAAADPYGLRAALAMLLVIGAVSAGGDFWWRVARSALPHGGTANPAVAAGFDIWITPPEYTGLAPIYLDHAGSASGEPVRVPAGSAVLAQVRGGRNVPELRLDARAMPLQRDGDRDFTLTAKLGDAGHLAIAQDGAVLADVALQPVPDQPPTAEWAGPVQTTPQAALRLGYTARDDYGVAALTIVAKRVEAGEAAIELPVTVPARSADVKGVAYEDLTASRWAGQPVDLTLVARDALGQTGTSAPVRLVLPERVFHNPVARAIIAQRKQLLTDPSSGADVADALNELAARPGVFNNDISVFLGLRAATHSLAIDRQHHADDAVVQLLWDTALRVEQGQVPEAQKSLRQAHQALQDALDRNAPDAEIDALTRALQQAMDRYLKAMIDTMRQNGTEAQAPQAGGAEVSADDLQKMLDQARDLAKSGAKDAAKQALARLEDMLESLRAGNAGGQKNGPAQQMMQALKGLSKQQQDLLDKSFQAGQQNGKGGKGSMPGDLAGAQNGLRRQLGEMMRKLGENGEIPEPFGRAERAMRDAEGSLRQGQPGAAVQPQGDAMRQLQQAARALEQQNQEAQQQGTGARGESDPFGRTGPIDNGDVKIPTTADMQKSREILDELRRRAGERSRPEPERQYIDRLLERF